MTSLLVREGKLLYKENDLGPVPSGRLLSFAHTLTAKGDL